MTRSQGDPVMWDGGKGFIRPFFSQLSCLRLQQELLNIGDEKLLRMQDLMKSPDELCRVMPDCTVNSSSGAKKTVRASRGGVETDYQGLAA